MNHDVEMPTRIAALEQDQRGYPVPYIVLRDNDGNTHEAKHPSGSGVSDWSVTTRWNRLSVSPVHTVAHRMIVASSRDGARCDVTLNRIVPGAHCRLGSISRRAARDSAALSIGALYTKSILPLGGKICRPISRSRIECRSSRGPAVTIENRYAAARRPPSPAANVVSIVMV